jgi:hypothetical protein
LKSVAWSGWTVSIDHRQSAMGNSERVARIPRLWDLQAKPQTSMRKVYATPPMAEN